MFLDKTPYLNGRPHNCHHCNNSLANIRNIYRGAGSTRYYDSEKCLIAGERLAAERELMRTARAAGMVHSHYLVGAVALVVLTLAFILGGGHRAFAHDPTTHQADELSEAKSKLYGTCCDGTDYSKLRIQEWETTERGWRVRYNGRWLEVPMLAKVYNMDNPDGEAKAWIFGEGDDTYVRCFMAGARS